MFLLQTLVANIRPEVPLDGTGLADRQLLSEEHYQQKTGRGEKTGGRRGGKAHIRPQKKKKKKRSGENPPSRENRRENILNRNKKEWQRKCGGTKNSGPGGTSQREALEYPGQRKLGIRNGRGSVQRIKKGKNNPLPSRGTQKKNRGRSGRVY